MSKSWLTLLALVSACGGATLTTTPQASGPTALVIQAGDNQQATIGAPVPVAPSVKAVGSAGEAIPGLQVTFAIASGGGSLEHTTATTGINGVATAGLWTLGAVPGPHTVTASASGLPTVTFHAMASQPPAQATDTTIGSGGGVVTVRSPGGPGDGFKVNIPPGGFPTATHVVIAVDTARTVSLPSGVTKVGPVYQISGFPAAQAGALIQVSLPVTRPSSIALSAFMRDPVTGRLELLSPVDRSASGFTVVSRHLSTALMFNAPASGAVQAAILGAAGSIEILLVEATESKIANGTDSGFRPGVDDWEFPNTGSYIAPGGHCEGQSLSAAWYYMRRKATDGKLNNRFNEIDLVWMEDRVGYRFASVVQKTTNFAAQREYLAAMRTLATAGSLTPDRLFYDAGALAILVTGEPQLSVIWTADHKSGHAIVVYQTDQTHMYVADPNFPGLARSVDYNGLTFSPFSASSTAESDANEYTDIAVVGTSNAIDLTVIDALWPKVLDKTIGEGMFPTYTLQYFDLLSNDWFDLADTLTTRQEHLLMRAVCATCVGGLLDVGGMAPHFVEWLRVYDEVGILSSGPIAVNGATADGIDVMLLDGTNKLGAWTIGYTGDDWGYLDWRWFTISAVRFGLTPEDSHIERNTTLDLAAVPHGRFPSQARYVWDFDDGTAPATVLNDSTISHKFTTSGLHNIGVEMWDHSANRKLARAVAVVEVTDTVTTWAIDSLWGNPPPNWITVDPQTTSDYARHKAFFAQLRTTPTNGLITYLEPKNNPSAATIRITQSPDPSELNSLLLAARNTVCQVTDTLIWTGTTSNGNVKGKGRPNVCLVGASPGLQVFPEIPRIEGIALGNTLRGTITIEYTDFDRINNFHIARGSITVIYEFRAHR